MNYTHICASLTITASVLLGACSSQTEYTGGADVERSVVKMVRLAHPVMAEDDDNAVLSQFSLDNLESFASTNEIGYGDVVLFDQGMDVSPERIEALSAWFTGKGVMLGETNGVFGASPPAGGVMVYVERYTVKAPDCDRWSQGFSSNHANAPGKPFGCVSQSNLAAMIANPRDLVAGEKDGANAHSAVRAVKAYRTKESSGGGKNR